MDNNHNDFSGINNNLQGINNNPKDTNNNSQDTGSTTSNVIPSDRKVIQPLNDVQLPKDYIRQNNIYQQDSNSSQQNQPQGNNQPNGAQPHEGIPQQNSSQQSANQQSTQLASPVPTNQGVDYNRALMREFGISDRVTPGRCLTVGIVGIVCSAILLGTLGIHDFIVGRWKQGIIHAALAAGWLILTTIAGNLTRVTTINDYAVAAGGSRMSMLCMYLGALLRFISIVYTLFESIMMIKIAKKAYANNTQNTVPAKITYSKALPIISIIAALMPVLLYVFCLISSRGSTSENGPGAVWWLMVLYVESLGWPIFATAIVTGILGLKSKAKWLSVVSLAVQVLVAAYVIMLFSGILR